MSEQVENIYDDNTISLLNDLKGWVEDLKKKPKVDYKTDALGNLVPLIVRIVEVTATRMYETEQVVMEQLNENTLQPDFAAEILAVLALAEEAINAALVPPDNEKVKQFRAAVAELVPKIEEATLDLDDETEGDDGEDEGDDGEDDEQAEAQ